jgi:hypothetical protein
MSTAIMERRIAVAGNERCHACGQPWTFREPWWAYGGSKTSTALSWGYLVHCVNHHFHWYRSELTEAELRQGEARFKAVQHTVTSDTSQVKRSRIESRALSVED